VEDFVSSEIWKYEIKNGTTQIPMPAGAYILSVQPQSNPHTGEVRPVIWAIVDPAPDKERQLRRFIVIETGQQFDWDDDMDFIGTFQLGSLVHHLFEVDNDE
jgi:hypothetical protein